MTRKINLNWGKEKKKRSALTFTITHDANLAETMMIRKETKAALITSVAAEMNKEIDKQIITELTRNAATRDAAIQRQQELSWNKY